MDSTFSFTQDRLTEMMIKMYKPDHLISIPRNICGVFDFDRGKQIYEAGITSFQEELGQSEK
ncbi:MAG TPA: hypothetical protein VJ941_08410, partial [Gracilimonas sp.]|nr:hypothetical protein [Gracilimonas sp.]